MTSAQRNIVIQYLNRREGIPYSATAKPKYLPDFMGSRHRKVTDAMLPSIKSPLLRVNSKCMARILSYLRIRNIFCLDIAITNTPERLAWLSILSASHVYAIDKLRHCNKSIRWLVSRDISPRSLVILSSRYGDSNKIKLNDLNPSSLLRISLPYCDLKGEDLLSLAHGCPNLLEISLERCKGVKNESVVAFGKLCTNMKNINISRCKNVNDIGVMAIAQNCSQLSIINISWCKKITDISLLAIARNCPLLSIINISWCEKITDTGLSAIAQNCPKLMRIDFSWCEKITDVSLSAIAENCPLLNSIDISSCKKITNVSLVALAQNCPELHSVDLSWCVNVTSTGLLTLTQNLPQLNNISVSGCKWLTNSDVLTIGRNCNHLRTIDLSHLNITDDGVVGIAVNCPYLYSINLDHDYGITKVSLIALVEKCPEMEQIKLYNVRGLDEIVRAIRRRYPYLRIDNAVHTDIEIVGGN